MSDRHRINKVLKTLQEGTEAVRRNSSEQNYQRYERKIKQAGQRTNPLLWFIGMTTVVAILVLLFSLLAQKEEYLKNTQRKSIYKFPLSSCGDKTSGGTNIWYPVYIDYNASDLHRISKYFCCDAYYDSSFGVIQVASFYSRSRAYKLMRELKSNNFQSATVGEGQVVTTRPSSNRNNCR